MTRRNHSTARPVANEARIREMHDRAGAAAKRAAQHETNAARIIAEAETAAEEMTGKVEERAEEHMRRARAMAAQMIQDAKAKAQELVAQAEAQAAQHVGRAEAEAAEDRSRTSAEGDENVRQAHLVAQQERDGQMAEQQDRDYWTSLAAAESAAAGLQPVPPTRPLETVPDGSLDVSGEVAQQ